MEEIDERVDKALYEFEDATQALAFAQERQRLARLALVDAVVAYGKGDAR